MARAKRARAAEGDTRDRITKAALDEFARVGFDGASTRMISRLAGVNQGLINYYFGSKYALWKAAVDRVFARLVDAGASYVAGKELEPRERLRLAIHYFVRFAAANPEVHRFMIHEGNHANPRMKWLLRRYIAPIYTELSELVSAVRGEPPALPPAQFFAVLIGAGAQPFSTAAVAEVLFGFDPRSEPFVTEYARTLEHILVGPFVRDG